MPRTVAGLRNEIALAALGTGMWFVLAGQLAALAWLVPDQARAMAVGLGTELAFGREAGIPAGLAAGLHPLLMWETSVVQDFATAFLGYPVFLYLLHRFRDKDVYLMRRLRRIEQQAQEHERFVHRWGPLGIGLFMLIPFLVNGPFVALILGRLTGIHTRQLLAPVVLATVLVAGAWTFALDAMLRLADTFDERLGYWAAALAVLAVAVAGIVDFVREHRAARA